MTEWVTARYRGSEVFLVGRVLEGFGGLLYSSGVVAASAKHLAIPDYRFLVLIFMTVGMNQTFD